MIWNERSRAKVAAGDVIFFPRKHAHSLESIGGGMDVVGLIHPGDNPGINYSAASARSAVSASIQRSTSASSL